MWSREKPLFVFELANNHDGEIDHGISIIRSMSEIAKSYPFNFAAKLQFRELDTFIHPAYRDRTDFKYIKRFTETRLSKDQFQRLRDEMGACGILAMCTPFDEPSVDLIEELDFDILKIASCSLTDWSLLERVVRSKKPIIASTAGSSLEDIDRVVSFLKHRDKRFALMHCVAAYPTRRNHLELNQIDVLRGRYPDLAIGYSTHEEPGNVDAIRVALGKGAVIFEKHVGVPAGGHQLNAYSATPDHVRAWLDAARDTMEMCGVLERRMDFPDDEQRTLQALRRGAFAAQAVAKGERLTLDRLNLQIPLSDGQVSANDLSKYTHFIAQRDLAAGDPVMFADVEVLNVRERVYDIVQRVKKLLAESTVRFPGEADLEISHHYGIERFDEVGTTLITVVNREYCKKLIISLAGQVHPEQYHNKKEETFHVLHGRVRLTLDGNEKSYGPGDVITVERGVRHSFVSDTGVVIEEISSSHYVDDSFYTDPKIGSNKNRKTLLTHWM